MLRPDRGDFALRSTVFCRCKSSKISLRKLGVHRRRSHAEHEQDQHHQHQNAVWRQAGAENRVGHKRLPTLHDDATALLANPG